MINIFSKKNKRVYLDHAAATLSANASGIYSEGVLMKSMLEQSRKEILHSFDAVSQKIIFTGSATQSINIALQGLLTAGDHLVISSIEHPAVIECAKFLQREKKIELTILPVDETGLVSVRSLRESLKSNTKLVSIIYASNELGTVQPIKEIGRVISEHNREHDTQIYFHTDATQAVNYLDIRMNSNRLDMISFNGSKIYAGKGVGALIYEKNLKLHPIIYGGGQENGLWSGTEDVDSIVRLATAITDINNVKGKNFKNKESARLEILKQDFLKDIQKEIPEVKIWSKAESSLPNIINIGLPNFESDEMVVRLDEKGFAVSHKSACAAMETGSGSYVLQAIGASIKESSENIRISMGRNTTSKEMTDLAKAIKLIYSKFAKA
jgi:cysteine desulfurase